MHKQLDRDLRLRLRWIGRKLLRRTKRTGSQLTRFVKELWRKENIGLLVRLAVAILLIGFSAPPLRSIFMHKDWYGVGALFEASADCDLQFYLNNQMRVLSDGSASGNLEVGWTGDVAKCNQMKFRVPGAIRYVESYPKTPDGQQQGELRLITIFAPGNDKTVAGMSLGDPATINIDPASINTNVYRKNNPGIQGYINIEFDEFGNFIQPISYTKSVTNLFVRSFRLIRPGQSHDDFRRGYVPIPNAVMISKVQFPGRYTVSQAFVGNPSAVSLDGGKSELSWNGSGMVYLDDMDHIEVKDLVILIDGILFATGLALLAEFVCQCASRVAGPASKQD